MASFSSQTASAASSALSSPSNLPSTARRLASSPPTGFRSPSRAMASFPRLLFKMATFGFLDTDTLSLNVSTPEASTAVANATASSNSSSVAADVVAAAAATAAGGTSETDESTVLEGVRSMGSIFTYITSKWAIMCLFMTVLLNRTMIYASLRRPIQLPLKIRLMIRTVPILVFLPQVYHMVLAMRCQSSPAFMGERKVTDLDEPSTAFYFHAIGKAGSWWMDDREACEAIGLIPDAKWIDLASSINNTEVPEIELAPPRGSLEILWPLYKSLSLSQFVEAFSCALTGRTPAAETGMTLLEHSLAFAEAEGFAVRKTYRLETTDGDDETVPPKVLRVKGQRIIPPEVLYIALISSLSHITSHIMAVLNKQAKYRLITTGVFGIAFLGGFALALIRGGSLGILEFPTVSVIGFIPHLLILFGILVCGGIYALALAITSLFPPAGSPRGLRQGFNNLRANLTLSSVSVSLSEDFYTTLLKIGFMCLTAASEATFLNEGRPIRAPNWTWLEAERSKVLNMQRTILGIPISGQYAPATNTRGSGPYALERKDFTGVVPNPKSKLRSSMTNNPGRWSGAVELLRGVGVVLAHRFARLPSQSFSDGIPSSAHDAFLAPTEDEPSDEPEHHVLLSAHPLPEFDDSPDYIPDEDLPSSPSTSDSEEEGDTREDMRRRRKLSPTPASTSSLAELIFETPSRLASLLDPQTLEDKRTAHLLARHLTSPQVLTRHAYNSSVPETEALESILLSRRQEARRKSTSDDDERGGPVCVVCQTAPRTIIVWPCRCLSLCEDCRVCLAMNNFANCVTCRQKSEGFSRIFVP